MLLDLASCPSELGAVGRTRISDRIHTVVAGADAFPHQNLPPSRHTASSMSHVLKAGAPSVNICPVVLGAR